MAIEPMCAQLSDSEEELPGDVESFSSGSQDSDYDYDEEEEPETCTVDGCGNTQQYMKRFVFESDVPGKARPDILHLLPFEFGFPA